MPTISSLLIGELTKIQDNCLKSFVKNKFDFILYSYHTPSYIPEGITWKNAEYILDKSEMFSDNNGDFSAFINLFRFVLMYRVDTIWIDLDLFCLENKNSNILSKQYIISSIPSNDYTKIKLSTSLLKFSKNDIITYDGIQKAKRDKENILKNKIIKNPGQDTLFYLVNKYSLNNYVLDWKICSICSQKDYELLNLNKIPDETNFIKLFSENIPQFSILNRIIF